MSALVASWQRARPEGRGSSDTSWTTRFIAGSALALLYALIQLEWLGLVPGTAMSVVVQATWVGLVGWYALRIGAAGLSFGLFVTTFVLFFDQVTLAVGVAQLPSALPDDYWFSNTLRVAAVLAVYPWLVRRIGSRLRGHLGLAAVPLSLAPLPFLRFLDAPNLVLESITAGVGGIILPVPWPPVVLGATVVASVIDLVGATPTLRGKPSVLVIVTLVVTLGIPGLGAARDEYARTRSVLVAPAASGPLDFVRLEAAVPEASSATVTWDGVDAVGPDGGAVRAFSRHGVLRAFVLPALQADLRAGDHIVGLRIGGSERVASHTLQPPARLATSLAARYVTVAGGYAGEQLQVLVLGGSGPEQFAVRFDQAGGWRSSIELPPGSFRIVAQAGASWAMLVVDR